MSALRTVTATIASGPNAGCTAIFLADLGGTEELRQLSRVARRQLRTAGIREINAATHSEFMSAEFLEGLTGAAALVIEGMFDVADLEAVISSPWI